MKILLLNLKTKTFKNLDFYFTTADQICLNIKNLAQRNKCYCEIDLQTKLKSYSIPKGHGDLSNISKSIIEQSNAFPVFAQTKFDNGSIEVLIGDIAFQKVSSEDSFTRIISDVFRSIF